MSRLDLSFNRQHLIAHVRWSVRSWTVDPDFGSPQLQAVEQAEQATDAMLGELATRRAAVGGRVRLVWLRHPCASLAYAATKVMKAVAARLGHTSTRMMDQVYVQVYEEESRHVADAIDELAKRSLRHS